MGEMEDERERGREQNGNYFKCFRKLRNKTACEITHAELYRFCKMAQAIQGYLLE